MIKKLESDLSRLVVAITESGPMHAVRDQGKGQHPSWAMTVCGRYVTPVDKSTFTNVPKKLTSCRACLRRIA